MKLNNATPLININSYKAQSGNKVAFKGNITKNLKDVFQLERAGNMSRNLFTLNAFVFLLGSRLVTSRDKNERRETLTRDVPTILIAVFGVPVIEEFLAAKIHLNKKFGFATCDAKSSGTGYKSASYNQLTDWYKYDEKLSTGFKGFAERLDDRGGNLKKIYSTISKEMKTDLAGFSDDNKVFMKELFDGNDAKTKKLVNKLEVLFAEGDNKALLKAKWLKTVPSLAGFAITLASIGIMIPKLNIAITQHLNTKKSEDPKATVETAKTV